MTNYQIILDETINNIVKENKRPKLLLHSCCAPCSSYVLEYLTNYFDITVFYYNPNISSYEEYEKRYKEVQRFIHDFGLENKVSFINGSYDNDKYEKLIKGLENEKEGGTRCEKCYYLRLEETCKYAKEHGFDYFTTTLSISPYKNSEKLNSTGKKLEDKYDVLYLLSDFKKKNGYKRSIELSREYNLYRQNYCGCIYSQKASLNLEKN